MIPDALFEVAHGQFPETQLAGLALAGVVINA